MVDGAPSVRRRRFRRLRSDRRGVVSVIGTLLALLVFFALFGIFLTQYVPLWMTDNEAEWTSTMQGSLADLQSNMNLQVDLGSAGLLSTPFNLASNGIPLIAQPTPAILGFIPQTAGVFVNISSTQGPGGGGPFYQNVSLGALRVLEQNRYFPPQSFEFENGAVIQSQADIHQIVAFPPPLVLNASGSNVGATLVIFQMVGNATQAVSTGTEEVYSDFLGSQTYVVHGGGPFNALLVEGTHYACAWQSFFNQTAHTPGVPPGTVTVTPSGCVASAQKAQDVTIALRSLNYLEVVVANFEIVIGVGVE